MTVASMETLTRERSSSCSRLHSAACYNVVPAKRTHFKAAGQSVLAQSGNSSLIGLGSVTPGESWAVPNEISRTSSENSPLMHIAMTEAMNIVGSRCRTFSETSDNGGVYRGSPKSLHIGLRSRASSSMSNDCGTSHKASSSLAQVSAAGVLPKCEVDWLMGTLRKEDLDKCNSRFFLNDCQRRFRELDSDSTGLLSIDNLQVALVDMYPTLQLELAIEGHRIPALHKSIPGLIATFDSNADGHLDFDDFVRFVKFQQAWRAQFFLSRQHGSEALIKTEAQKGMRKQADVFIGKDTLLVKDSLDGNIAFVDNRFDKDTVRRQLGWSRESCFRQSDLNAAAAANSFLPSKACARRTKCKLDNSRGAFYSSFSDLPSIH